MIAHAQNLQLSLLFINGDYIAAVTQITNCFHMLSGLVYEMESILWEQLLQN